jgi:ABC-2 type transport system ATP-binding protein
LLELKNVTKTYGRTSAVEGVSFKVEKGEIVGLLGRNGAGKTSILNIIAGYTSCTEGTVIVGGFDIMEDPKQARKKIGYLPEQLPLYSELTVEEYLRFICRLKGVDRARIRGQMQQMLEASDIADVRKRLIKNLSRGYKQRVSLAQALCGDPEILLLDEPTVGLDPRQVIDLRNTIRRLGKDHTVLLCTHILNEVSELCGKVIIMRKGKIVAERSLPDFAIEAHRGNRILVRLSGTEREGKKVLQTLHEVMSIDCLGQKEAGFTDFLVESNGQDLRAVIFDAVRDSALRLIVLLPLSPSFEETFLELTSDDKEAF